MENVEGSVAVVTGGASGIGRGLAIGSAHVLCLNAGVFAGGHAWEVTDADWDWVLGVNVRGVANGLRAFVPHMIDAAEPAHVLVTASMAAVVAAPASAVYVTSKFAALGLAESLHHDLAFTGNQHIAVSVICPGMVDTGIAVSGRNRPEHFADATDTDGSATALGAMRDMLPGSLDAGDGARTALGQAFAGRFYCTTHEGDMWERLVGIENDDRLAGRPPSFQIYE